MSMAADAVAALHETARANYKAVFEAGSQFANRHIAVAKAEDVVVTMAASIDMLVAAEALHDASEAAVKALRTTLAAQMAETGAAAIQGTHHTAGLAKRPAFVSIDNEAELPAEYLITKTAPDKKAIASAIKDGVAVPGASLLTPNEQVLVLRARKETA